MCDLDDGNWDICEIGFLIRKIESLLNYVTTSSKGIDYVQADSVKNLVNKLFKEHENEF
jgi:hypothetical protein